MNTIIVTTQKELDKALSDTNQGRDAEVEIRSPKTRKLRVSGSARVYAYGSATVHARSARTTIHAADTVAVHMHEPANVTGGVQITPPEPKALTVDEAIERWLADKPTEGTVRLFKAVDADLKSERGFAYPIGETVEAPDWNAEPKCGGGLHVSPSPHHATRYFMGAARWLEVEVAVEDLALCSTGESFPDKAKARRLRVVREVGLGGQPV